MKLMIFFSLLVGLVSAEMNNGTMNPISDIIYYTDPTEEPKILKKLEEGAGEPPVTENHIDPKEQLILIEALNAGVPGEPPVTENPIDVENQKNDPNVCFTPQNVKGACVKSGKCNNGNVPQVKRNTFFAPYRAMIQDCPIGHDCCVEHVNEAYTAKDDDEQVLVGCGVRNRDGTNYRTLNRKAKAEEFPWTVAIYRFRNKHWKYICSGSLIHQKVVLSVAHYFDRFDKDDPEEAFRVHAGDLNLKEKSELGTVQDSEVDNVRIHEEYDDGAKSYDVGLLFLRTDIKPASNIGFACLPESARKTPEGTKCIMSGWGMDQLGRKFQDVMKMVEVPIKSHRWCQSRIRDLVFNPDYELSESILCAGGEKGKDACKGDGGAPLVCAYTTGSSRYYQAGIVSWGIGCGEENSPGAYVDVAVVRDWIDDVLVQNAIESDTYTPPKTY